MPSLRATFSKLTTPASLLLIAAMILATGIRFTNLANKVFWADETLTAIRSSGHFVGAIVGRFFHGQEVKPAELQAFRILDPHSTALDVINASIEEDQQVPPLYYLCVHTWMMLFGSTDAAVRSLSVVASLFCLPLVFLLGRELFPENHLCGAFAALILGLSPLQLLYAQEARPYAFFNALVLLSSWLLCKSTARNGSAWWFGYALAATAGLYVQPFFFFVIAAHTLFVCCTTAGRGGHVIKRMVVALAAIGLLFAPWAWIMVVRFDSISQSSKWLSSHLEPALWQKMIVLNLVRNFADFNGQHANVFNILQLSILSIILGSLFTTWRYAGQRAKVMLFSLAALPLVPFLLYDLAAGGVRAIIARYFFASYLSIVIMVAFALSHWVHCRSLPLRASAIALCILVPCVEAFSCFEYLSASSWWNKATGLASSSVVPALAAVINRTPAPLLLASCNAPKCGDLVCLSEYLQPKVTMQVVNDDQIPDLRPGHSNVFVFMPDQQFLENIRQKFNCLVIPVDSRQLLWILQPRNN